MTETQVLDLFRQSGALLEGHFKLSSGPAQRSLPAERARAAASRICRAARRARSAARLAHLEPTVVLSPALGGIVIGQEVGRALQIRAIFAERQEGKLSLRRGFTLSSSDRVVVIEDVITTGGSTRETSPSRGGRRDGASAPASIIDRGVGHGAPEHPAPGAGRMQVPPTRPRPARLRAGSPW